jgi:large subunit ribosomal protein L6
MSRIGKIPVTIPAGVTVQMSGITFTAKGPKGTLTMSVHPHAVVSIEGDTITVKRKSDSSEDRALQGLTRAMVHNMVEGVAKGFQKKLELNGVGFRAQASGKKITLSLGFSHPIVIEAPEGVTFAVEENIVTVSGADRHLVGEIAARVRSMYVPEPYKGKGIRYTDEHVARKEGKRVAATT